MSTSAERAKKIFIGFTVAGLVLVVMGYVVNRRLDQLGMPLSEVGRTTQDGAVKRDASGTLPVLSDAIPAFGGIAAWINSEPLTPEQLKGKVVLVDFWTYSCINCIRTFPYVTSWHDKYKDKGLVVIGMHTPEFDFEKSQANVERAMVKYGIKYPVALDNEYGTWNNFSNRYWPAHYLFDAKGQLRYYHFGEGEYDETEAAIQALLKEAGVAAEMALTEHGEDVNFQKIGSPETYLGYERMEHFGSPETVANDQVKNYSIPEVLRLNTFALLGSWQIEGERSVLANGQGDIAYHFSAANANLVMGAPVAAGVRAEITLDGAPVPADKRGADVVEIDGRTYVQVGEERLYDLIDTHGEYGTHKLNLRFETDGVECYAFTFG